MRYLILILFLAIGFTSQSQSPYQTETGTEIGIFGAGLTLSGISGYINAKNDILNPEDLELLDANNIWKFDRWVTKQYNLKAKKSSDIVLYTSFVLPLTLLADENARGDFGKVGLMSVQTLLLNSGLTNITKTTVKRPRPYLYNEDVALRLKLKKSDRYSFFSGHTSTTAAMSFLTASMYNDYNPGNNNTVIWGLAALIPAYTGMQRVRAGKHFLSDVIVGYVVGAGVGLLGPALHRH